MSYETIVLCPTQETVFGYVNIIQDKLQSHIVKILYSDIETKVDTIINSLIDMKKLQKDNPSFRYILDEETQQIHAIGRASASAPVKVISTPVPREAVTIIQLKRKLPLFKTCLASLINNEYSDDKKFIFNISHLPNYFDQIFKDLYCVYIKHKNKGITFNCDVENYINEPVKKDLQVYTYVSNIINEVDTYKLIGVI